jgi:hypothetical protein
MVSTKISYFIRGVGHQVSKVPNFLKPPRPSFHFWKFSHAKVGGNSTYKQGLKDIVGNFRRVGKVVAEGWGFSKSLGAILFFCINI